MARAQKIDEKAALEATVKCLWEWAHDTTPIRSPGAQVSVGPNLYNAAGDERAPSRKVLQRYAQTFR